MRLNRIAIILLFFQRWISISYYFLIREEDDSGEDSEGSEEEDLEEESSEEEAGTSAATGQPALSRTEKRDLKKKQAEEGQRQAEVEDPDLINPNHVQQKMNISDLNTPRGLSRRERYAKIST